MEYGNPGNFIPIEYNIKSDTFKSISGGTLVDEKELNLIHKKIDSILINMGKELHNGKIEPVPIVKENGESMACSYCDYFPICRTELTKVKPIFNNSEAEKSVMNKLIEEFN